MLASAFPIRMLLAVFAAPWSGADRGADRGADPGRTTAAPARADGEASRPKATIDALRGRHRFGNVVVVASKGSTT